MVRFFADTKQPIPKPTFNTTYLFPSLLPSNALSTGTTKMKSCHRCVRPGSIYGNHQSFLNLSWASSMSTLLHGRNASELSSTIDGFGYCCSLDCRPREP